MKDKDLLGPPTTRWPWPPPVTFEVLFELQVALRNTMDEPGFAELVPSAERESFASTPIEWCLAHGAAGRRLLDEAIALMRGFEFFRKFRPPA
jgi:hypothetical protein